VCRYRVAVHSVLVAELFPATQHTFDLLLRVIIHGHAFRLGHLPEVVRGRSGSTAVWTVRAGQFARLAHWKIRCA